MPTSKIEWLAILVIVGTALISWLLFIFSAIFGYELGFWLVMIVGVGASILAIKQIWQQTTSGNFNYQQLIFVFIWSSLFIGLLQTRMLQIKSDGWYSGGASWGDLALHTSFISKFSTQKKLDLTSPIYAQQETRYPFLYDFFTAQLVRYGISIQNALIYSSLGLLIAVLILFYRLALAITKSISGVWIASGLFFFNGGLGVWYFFTDFLQSKKSLLEFVLKQPRNYAHIVDKGIYFSNVITDLLLPQRGIVLGLALFLVILILWQKKNYAAWIVSSFLIGIMPLIHVHTYLLLLGCWLWLLAIKRWQKIISTKQIFFLLGPAAILGGAQLWWMGIGQNGPKFISFISGWMQPKEFIGWFWLKNLGLELFFLTIGNIIIFWKTEKRTIFHHLLIPLIGIFLLGNIVSLQPYVYDNIKLFFYVHLLTALFSAFILLKITRHSRMFATIIFLTLTITGGLSVLRENQVSWQLASNEDLVFAEQIQAHTNSTAIFLTADNHNHSIPMLAGRSVVMGYRGWLWTHGISYEQTEKDVKQMYAGGENALRLLKKYRVSYVVIGKQEQQQYKVNKNFFYKNFFVVSQDNSRTLFAI